MADFDFTRAFRSALMSLGFAYPVRYIAGFSVSALFYIIITAIHSDYPDLPIIGTIENHQVLFITSLGCLIAFGRSLFRPMLGSDNLSSWLDAIEETFKRGQLTKVQKALLWQRIAGKIIESVDLKLELNREKLERIAREDQEEQKFYSETQNREDPQLLE